MLLAIDFDEDLVDVERVAVASVPPFQSACINGSELDTEPAPSAQRVLWVPEAYRFSGYSDASFGEQIFNEWSGIPAMTEIEAKTKPDSIGNNVRWESVAFVCVHPPILPISVS